ncbi:hypothetical protein [Pseudomonas yamanorum]|uniref:Uncharacterized protein n=1 Tax=Pseudomonas yamanorum TaxID=515393 RepID=A0AAJ3H862_9PSED|nr:hypothetical protein [Pseudomonas yamanorum]NWD44264.1 hypothetical protein [Pseudomonas yamanorum]
MTSTPRSPMPTALWKERGSSIEPVGVNTPVMSDAMSVGSQVSFLESTLYALYHGRYCQN